MKSFSWTKLGLLLSPNEELDWMSSHVGPSFVEKCDHSDRLNLYFTGRDASNVSRIGFGKLEIENQHTAIVSEIHDTPLLAPGPVGAFDENGVSYPWLTRVQDKIHMYYVGWVAGGKSGFQNYLGLAISRNGGKSFERYSNVPILDRTSQEPFGTGSCAVFQINENYLMLYTSFLGWDVRGPQVVPKYDIKLAYSKDGIDWARNYKAVVPLRGEETVIGKPFVRFDGNLFHVWYSFRGEKYRIGYANGPCLSQLKRRDDLVGIDVGDRGWDSEMIEYAFIFSHKNVDFMIYNGNGYGKTGLGIAKARSEQ